MRLHFHTLEAGKDPTPTLHPKSGLPDFDAKHVEFGNSRIRLDGEGDHERDLLPYPPSPLLRPKFQLPAEILRWAFWYSFSD